MLCSLKSLVVGSFFFMLFFLPTSFDRLSAEQGAWGGNGGWWGGGNREWEGDFDGPGYHKSPCHCYSNYSHPYSCPHPHPYSYDHHCHHNCCHPDRYNPSTPYYYDESVPGAGLYLNLNGR